jgi:hypothetical protein
MTTDECTVLYECDGINIKYKNRQKDWHPATKPLKEKTLRVI